MCIVIGTTVKPPKGYVAAYVNNREERYDRPTSDVGPNQLNLIHPVMYADSVNKLWPSEFANVPRDQVPYANGSTSGETDWLEEGKGFVICGRDLTTPNGGTWAGTSVLGDINDDSQEKVVRIGSLTNIRQPTKKAPINAISRGDLVRNFLAPPKGSASTMASFIKTTKDDSHKYDRFNFLAVQFTVNKSREDGSSSVFGPPEVFYLSNCAPTQDLSNDSQPFRGVSNYELQDGVDAWPKVVNGEKAMQETTARWEELGEDEKQLINRYFKVLEPTQALDCLVDTKSCTRIMPMLVNPSKCDEPLTEDTPPLAQVWYGTTVSAVTLLRDDGTGIVVVRKMGWIDRQGQMRSYESNPTEVQFEFSVFQNSGISVKSEE